MQKTSRFNAHALGEGAARAAKVFLTRQLFYGAAVSCVLGVSVGFWLRPPPAQIVRPGSMQPVAPPQPADDENATSLEAPQTAPLPVTPAAQTDETPVAETSSPDDSATQDEPTTLQAQLDSEPADDDADPVQTAEPPEIQAPPPPRDAQPAPRPDRHARADDWGRRDRDWRERDGEWARRDQAWRSLNDQGRRPQASPDQQDFAFAAPDRERDGWGATDDEDDPDQGD